jgi:UDP-GlcNAc:undecaprenyl-phosphate GlcNAc-1-phosphate transferase
MGENLSFVDPILSFALAAALALLVTPWVKRLAYRIGALDRPTHRRNIRRRTVPRLGGISLFVGCWGAMSLMLVASSWIGSHALDLKLLATLLGAGLVMLLLGMIDDKYDLSAKIKLLIQIAVATAVVMAGIRFEEIGLLSMPSLKLGWASIPLSIFFIVGITNAVNMIDGVDGLASGSCLIISAAVAIIGALNNSMTIAFAGAALAGACAGFLRYNFSPARIFLGDSGSLFAGMSLAILAIAGSAKTTVAGSMLIPVLLLGYPTLDTLLVMLRRKLSGRSMFSGDHGHIHHRLIGRGMSHGQTAVTLYVVCLLFCFLGVSLAIGISSGSLVALSALGVALLVGAILLNYPSHLSVRQLRLNSPHYRVAQCRAHLAAAELELAQNTQEAFDTLIETIRRLGVRRLTVLYPNPADANLHRRRRQRIAMNLNGSSNGHSSKSGNEGTAVDTYRFPENKVTIRARIERNGYSEELDLEHRIQLNQLFKVFSKRLNELSLCSVVLTKSDEATHSDEVPQTSSLANHSPQPG